MGKYSGEVQERYQIAMPRLVLASWRVGDQAEAWCCCVSPVTQEKVGGGGKSIDLSLQQQRHSVQVFWGENLAGSVWVASSGQLEVGVGGGWSF